MENLLFTFTQKKYPSKFLVEQRAKSNEQRAKSSEQQAKSNQQRATSKKFSLQLLSLANVRPVLPLYRNQLLGLPSYMKKV